jgi:hypothetical protein
MVTSKQISSGRYGLRKNAMPRVGQVIAVMGFGNPDLGYLKGTYMTVAGYENSGSFVARSIDGSTSCTGDSGGPALVKDRGRILVVGVVSRGQAKCGIGSATVFGATGSSRGYNWLVERLNSVDR